MSEIAAALTAARAAYDLVRGAVAARDDAKVQVAMTEMGAKLLDAMSSALAASEKAAALQAALDVAQREKAEIHRQLLERAKYALHEVRAGAFVYASQQEDDGIQAPQHYLCQPCCDDGRKRVLRSRPATSGFPAMLECPENPAHSINMGGALPLNWNRTLIRGARPA